MTTVVPGYRVTVELFLPADPEQPRQIAQSAALLDSLPEQLERIGLPGASVSFRFVSRHRLSPSPSPPAPAPDPQGEPTQPLDLANIVLPDGQTVGEVMREQIAIAYREGKMPPLLPDYSKGGSA